MDENIKSHFLALYCMVLADGIIDANELQVLYQIGENNYGITQKEIMDAVNSTGTSFSIPETLTNKITLLYNLAEIAWADGKIEDVERKLLKKYALHCGFLSENVDDIVEFILEAIKTNLSVEDIIKQITRE